MRTSSVSRPKAIDIRDRGSDGVGKTALVTGASSGIGRAMADLLAAKGFDVVLVARRKERLVGIAQELNENWGVTGIPLVADLADPSAPTDIVAELEASGIHVDFLVNNAGYSQRGRYDSFSWEDHEKRVRVMGTSTLELTHRVLPGMVEREWGRIINVSSISALFPCAPTEAIYSATKAMVQKFTESIAAEYAGSGIRCTVSIPGFTATEIFEVEGGGFEGIKDNPAYRAMMMSPATVARQAYDAVMSGKPQIVHGVHHKVMGVLLHNTPLPFGRWLVKALLERA
ncbi:SDR family NAD(P)-dependent oxidoreductase [Nocardia sp. NPDC055029]